MPSEEQGPGTGARIRAAGGLLWRSGPDGVQVAMVHRPRYDDWSMPKGKLAHGEHPLAAAVREVGEETGLMPVVGRRLPSQEYVLGPDRKSVDYWAMTAAGGEFAASNEVDALCWASLAEAARRLSYERDRDLLDAFRAAPSPTAMVLLVRHARAGSRSSWPGDDLERPLDATGRAQAEGLRRALAWFKPRRVLSAGPLRCQQTVQPLVADLGVPIELEPALSEEAYLKDAERSLDRLLAVVRATEPVVVCSQGGVIPDLVETLGRASGLPLPGPRVPARKASVWALSFRDTHLLAADYYPDLATAAS